jgi:hypothetical protein
MKNSVNTALDLSKGYSMYFNGIHGHLRFTTGGPWLTRSYIHECHSCNQINKVKMHVCQETNTDTLRWLICKGNYQEPYPHLMTVKPKASQSADSICCGPWYIYQILPVLVQVRPTALCVPGSPNNFHDQ